METKTELLRADNIIASGATAAQALDIPPTVKKILAISVVTSGDSDVEYSFTAVRLLLETGVFVLGNIRTRRIINNIFRSPNVIFPPNDLKLTEGHTAIINFQTFQQSSSSISFRYNVLVESEIKP